MIQVSRDTAVEDEETASKIAANVAENASEKNRRGNSGWWASPCGPGEVLHIALPLIISTMSFSVMHFCDRMFLAWYSTAALGAAVTAGVLTWTMFSLPMGIASYATTFVAQYYGAGQFQRIGLVIWQAIRIGLYCTPIFLLIALFAPALFRAAGHSQALVLQEAMYFQALSFCAGGVIIDAALNAFYVGRGKTRIIMVTNILGALLNIALDGWLIFGGLGVPAMGIVGAGIATSIAVWFKVIIYAWVMIAAPEHQIYKIFEGRRWDAALTKRLLRFGTPNGLQFMLEGGALAIFVLLIGRISEESAAATAVAFSVNMVAFVPVLGLGMAVTTLVGQKIGAGQAELAAKATWTSLYLALIYCAVFAVTYVAVPSWYLMAHSSVGDNFQEVHDIVIVLLRFVAAYCLFDAIQLIFVSAIKGAGDMTFVLAVTVISATLFVYVGNQIAKQCTTPTDQLYAWWYALTGWIVLLSLIYGGRFLHGKWKRMKVIEPELE